MDTFFCTFSNFFVKFHFYEILIFFQRISKKKWASVQKHDLLDTQKIILPLKFHFYEILTTKMSFFRFIGYTKNTLFMDTFVFKSDQKVAICPKKHDLLDTQKITKVTMDTFI